MKEGRKEKLKETLTQKRKSAESIFTPQDIQDLDEFVSSSETTCSITSLTYQWMLCMGAIRIRVQTAVKNITIIH